MCCALLLLWKVVSESLTLKHCHYFKEVGEQYFFDPIRRDGGGGFDLEQLAIIYKILD